MADNIKESLSAWLDGEASEIEVHRLLRQVDEDASLKSNWLAYQQIRSVIRQEQQLSTLEHQQLNHRIKAAVAAEPPYVDETASGRYATVKLLKPVVGLAVAASLVAAIFLGVQTTQLVSGASNQGPLDVAAQTVAESPVAATVLNDSNRQTTLASNDREPFGDESELRELDEEKKKFFRAYAMRHTRLSKMNPYGRVSTNKQK